MKRTQLAEAERLIEVLVEALEAEEAYQESQPVPWNAHQRPCRWCQECVLRKDGLREEALKAAKGES